MDNKTNGRSDHDLLITISEKVENLTREVRTSNDGNRDRISALEVRVGKIEDDHLSIGGVQEAFRSVRKNSDWIENEKRNRVAYRILYVAVTGIISFIVSIFALKSGILGIK